MRFNAHRHVLPYITLLSQVLSGLDFYFVFLDDILVYSTSWKEHLQHLEMVFKCLKEENLKINLEKCQFFKKHLHYVGHLISEHCIQPLPEKVSATEKVNEPRKIHKLCNFLDLTDY